MNQIITIGAMLIGISMTIFLANMIYSTGKGKPANTDDPWDLGGKYYYPFQSKNPNH